jgi:hypothetical protein
MKYLPEIDISFTEKYSELKKLVHDYNKISEKPALYKFIEGNTGMLISWLVVAVVCSICLTASSESISKEAYPFTWLSLLFFMALGWFVFKYTCAVEVNEQISKTKFIMNLLSLDFDDLAKDVRDFYSIDLYSKIDSSDIPPNNMEYVKETYDRFKRLLKQHAVALLDKSAEGRIQALIFIFQNDKGSLSSYEDVFNRMDTDLVTYIAERKSNELLEKKLQAL